MLVYGNKKPSICIEGFSITVTEELANTSAILFKLET